MTVETIRNAISAHVNSYFVTETSDGAFQLPGLVVYWDENAGGGWAYREAQRFDADTMEWDGEESGALDTEAELTGLLARSVARLPEAAA